MKMCSKRMIPAIYWVVFTLMLRIYSPTLTIAAEWRDFHPKTMMDGNRLRA